MKLKTKLRLALTFLFAVILLLGGLSAWYLKKLSQEAQGILKDNYISLEYAHHMRDVIDSNNWNEEDFRIFENNLRQQEQNLTEVGEAALTQELRAHFNAFKQTPDSSRLQLMNRQLSQITDINMQAISRKIGRAHV